MVTVEEVSGTTEVHECHRVAGGSGIVGFHSPLASCGLFTIRGSSAISYRRLEVLKDIVALSKKYYNKPHCLILDTDNNFSGYEDSIKEFIVQKGEVFNNPSGSDCRLVILDCNKIREYLNNLKDGTKV